MASHDTPRHDRVSMALHWTIGIGILLLAGLELFRGEFPKGHFIREGLKPIHMPFGVILFGLILARVVWRFTGAKAPATHDKGAGALAAKLVHLALYALMLGLPLLGMIYVFGNDKAVDFGLFKLALPLKDMLGGIAKSSRWLHETLGIAILVIAGVHAAAAIGHHYVLKDDTMRRMLPGRRTRNSTERPFGRPSGGPGGYGGMVAAE